MIVTVPHTIAPTINPNTIDTENYTGNVNNKTDLSDKDYDYRGLEDDDDFEKVIIAGGTHDLALKKFIKKIQTNNNPEFISLSVKI